MNQMNNGSKPLAMTDWAANVEGISTSCRTLLWELVIHALVRDEILIQDEAIAQSIRLADWFENDSLFQVFDELIATGVIKFIVLAPDDFPEELQELARYSPITARAEQIRRESKKHGKPFHITDAQHRFHGRLDGVLRTHQFAIRSRHKGSARSVHERFKEYLLHVLQDKRCDTWTQPWFSIGHSPDEIIEYVEHPESAVARIRSVTPDVEIPKVILEDPRFTRNLGHLLAATFKKDQDAIDNLVHSAYAAAFCKNEGDAEGRYSAHLHELLLTSTALKEKKFPIVRLVSKFDIPLDLPDLKPGVAKILGDVRDTDAGKSLRQGPHGKDIQFLRLRENWSAVSAELAKHVTGGSKKVTFWGCAREIVAEAKEVLPVSFVSSLIHVAAGRPQAMNEFLSHLGAVGFENFAGAAYLVLNRNFLQTVVAEERLSEQLMSFCPYGVSDIEQTWPEPG